MDRDAAFALEVARQARNLGALVLTVDGRRSIDENAGILAVHFGFHDGVT